MRRLFFIVLFSPTWSPLCSQSLEYIVKPHNNFSRISNYCEGLAKVEVSHDSATAGLDSLWETIGYIDTTGKLLFEKRLDEAGSFHCGLAYAAKEMNDSVKYGFIGTEGQTVIPFIYDKVEDFSCDRAVVNKDGAWLVIDKSGRTIMDDSLLITERETGNHSGDSGQYEDAGPPAFHNGLMLVGQGEKYGYADTSGNIVIPCTLYNAFDFSDSAALVATDTAAENLPDRGSDWLDSLYNGLPPGPTAYHWAVIDITGHVLYTFGKKEKPDLDQYLSEGFFSFYNDSLKTWGVINRYGKIIIPARFSNEPLPFSDAVTLIQMDDTKRDNNKAGYLLVFDTSGHTLARVPLSGRYGTMYDSNRRFCEGLMAVKMDDKWGYIDKNGSFMIAPQFATALDFHDGCAVVVTQRGEVAVIRNPLPKH